MKKWTEIEWIERDTIHRRIRSVENFISEQTYCKERLSISVEWKELKKKKKKEKEKEKKPSKKKEDEKRSR